MPRERNFGNERMRVEAPTCEKCGAVLHPVTRPVDNLAIVVCEEHEEWARENIITGGEVIVSSTDE